MNGSRTKNTILNLFANVGGQVVSILLRFVSRTIFIYVLGKSYLGINGLFSNILEVLSLAELGVGTAIIYNMYEPLAHRDYQRLAALTNYYKILYRKIAGVVFVIGMAILPFLDKIINLNQDIPHIYLFYILSVLNTTVSYLYVYKTSILSADQKEYKLKIYRTVFQFIQIIAQSIILFLFKSYLLYMIVQIVCSICSNIWTAHKATELYPEVNGNIQIELSKQEKKNIWSNIKAMFSYKIGGIMMNNTSQILISALVSTEMVGIYSNYLMVTQSLTSITSMLFTSVKASIGNLATEKNHQKEYEVFRVLDLMAFWVYGGGTIGLIILMNDFIRIWAGNSYVLMYTTVIIIAFSFYIAGIIYPITCYRETIGLFKQTKNILLYSSGINLFLSIILGQVWGLNGILLATIIARSCTNLWYEPYKLYSLYFQVPFSKYVITHIKDAIIIILLVLLGLNTVGKISSGSIILDLVIKFVIAFIGINIVFIIYKNKEIKYVESYIKGILKIFQIRK